ncbi:type VI secretion system PAAR protein [Ningiella sp. W23]|uniref:type VI secretion system PAAR protein n=1 Tax=Ningiella sp. W23 TaxID=3023715 RepID=UPI0037584BC5
MSGKPAARLGDMGSNHGAWHPSPIIKGSGDVIINGIPAARQGDALAPHTQPNSPPHPRSIAQGAPTVFINNQPAARVGDAIDCGGKIIIGSNNVFIGDDAPPVEKIPITHTFALRFELIDELGQPVEGMPYRVVPKGQASDDNWHQADSKSRQDGLTSVVSTKQGEQFEYQLVWPKIKTDKAVALANASEYKSKD